MNASEPAGSISPPSALLATTGHSMRPQRKYSDNLKPYWLIVIVVIFVLFVLFVLFTNFMHDYVKHLSLHRPACIYVWAVFQETLFETSPSTAEKC